MFSKAQFFRGRNQTQLFSNIVFKLRPKILWHCLLQPHFKVNIFDSLQPSPPPAKTPNSSLQHFHLNSEGAREVVIYDDGAYI